MDEKIDLQGKKVLVVGSGKSGIGAAGLIAQAGGIPVLFDGNEKLSTEEIRERAGRIKGLLVLDRKSTRLNSSHP